MKNRYYEEYRMYKQSRFNTEIQLADGKIVYNSMTKAFLKIDNNEVLENALKDINSDQNGKERHENLIDQGFLVKADDDEITKLKYIFNKNYFDQGTLSIALMPSMACNFSCPYCFEEPYRDEKINPNFFSTLKKYANKNFKYYNHVDVNLFGGEPLLFFDDILDYLMYIQTLSDKYCFNFSTSIITNGSLLTHKIMDNLKKYNCTSMQITIDGCKRTHDKTRKFNDGSPSFDHLIRIINEIVGPYLNKMDLNFALRFNMLNNDLNEIKESLRLINPEIRSKVNVYFRSIYDTSCFEGNNTNTAQDYHELLEYANKIGFNIMFNQYFARSCEACSDTNFGYITSDLAFWKCLNAKDSDNELGKVGQILLDGTIKFDAERLVEWYKAANCFEDKKCLECTQLPDCLGGCIAYCATSSSKSRNCSEFNLTSLPFLYTR